jgi:cytochrome P450
MNAPSGFDFANPALRANPYPAYRFLREAAPLWRSPGGHWVLSTHAECTRVLRDPKMGRTTKRVSAQDIAAEPVIQMLAQMMLFQDPPDHTRLRGLVSKAFTARRMEGLRAGIEATVDELIDAVIDQGGMDVIADLGHKLPVAVICDMLGIPEQDRAQFMENAWVQGRLLDPIPMSRAEMDAANAWRAEFDGYFRALFAYRRRNPGEDLTSALLAAHEAEDTLSEDEILANVALLFVAGHETTSMSIGNGILALHRNPGELEKLKADPSLIPNAVEELLRYDSPVQITGRVALQDQEILGQTIAAGEDVLCLLGSANHDPKAFAGDPETVEVGRPGVRAMSFGGGLHHCLGAQLARIEAETVYRKMIERLPGLRLVDMDNPAWKPTITFRGLSSLPAVW